MVLITALCQLDSGPITKELCLSASSRASEAEGDVAWEIDVQATQPEDLGSVGGDQHLQVDFLLYMCSAMCMLYMAHIQSVTAENIVKTQSLRSRYR